MQCSKCGSSAHTDEDCPVIPTKTSKDKDIYKPWAARVTESGVQEMREKAVEVIQQIDEGPSKGRSYPRRQESLKQNISDFMEHVEEFERERNKLQKWEKNLQDREIEQLHIKKELEIKSHELDEREKRTTEKEIKLSNYEKQVEEKSTELKKMIETRFTLIDTLHQVIQEDFNVAMDRIRRSKDEIAQMEKEFRLKKNELAETDKNLATRTTAIFQREKAVHEKEVQIAKMNAKKEFKGSEEDEKKENKTER